VKRSFLCCVLSASVHLSHDNTVSNHPVHEVRFVHKQPPTCHVDIWQFCSSIFTYINLHGVTCLTPFCTELQNVTKWPCPTKQQPFYLQVMINAGCPYIGDRLPEPQDSSQSNEKKTGCLGNADTQPFTHSGTHKLNGAQRTGERSVTQSALVACA
jgi:hypothetical protein